MSDTTQRTYQEALQWLRDQRGLDSCCIAEAGGLLAHLYGRSDREVSDDYAALTPTPEPPRDTPVDVWADGVEARSVYARVRESICTRDMAQILSTGDALAPRWKFATLQALLDHPGEVSLWVGRSSAPDFPLDVALADIYDWLQWYRNDKRRVSRSVSNARTRSGTKGSSAPRGQRASHDDHPVKRRVRGTHQES